ncbi:hypothetical protein HQ34_07020 [Porphyromonas cangingivalis]|nr:hypothetical protein HQ34_07020 [Porphyromonas cangingivalis]
MSQNLYPQYPQLLSSFIRRVLFFRITFFPQVFKKKLLPYNIKKMKSVEKAKLIVRQTTK